MCDNKLVSSLLYTHGQVSIVDVKPFRVCITRRKCAIDKSTKRSVVTMMKPVQHDFIAVIGNAADVKNAIRLQHGGNN